MSLSFPRLVFAVSRVICKISRRSRLRVRAASTYFMSRVWLTSEMIGRSAVA